MISLTPRETRQESLPEQVGGLTLCNETIASIDFKIEIEAGELRITVMGIYLGKPGDSPFEPTKKKWVLS